MMKIIGEKSLASKVIVGLYGLFIAISFMDIVVMSIIIKTISHIVINEYIQNNIFDIIFYIMLVITGIIALIIICHFIKIFKNLRNNILFSENNTKSLKLISKSSFIISGLYFIIAIFTVTSYLNNEIKKYICIFAIILGLVFVTLGIGIVILNEIYKEAIKYKEENDFTI